MVILVLAIATQLGLVELQYLQCLRDYLIPKLKGMDSARIEKVWNEIYYSTRSN